MAKGDNFTLTKKIAKHGSQAVIVIPKILEHRLKHGAIVKLDISIVEEPADNPETEKKEEER